VKTCSVHVNTTNCRWLSNQVNVASNSTSTVAVQTRDVAASGDDARAKIAEQFKEAKVIKSDVSSLYATVYFTLEQ
jgi:hypothetical protein